jgi:hypothetical protein
MKINHPLLSMSAGRRLEPGTVRSSWCQVESGLGDFIAVLSAT